MVSLVAAGCGKPRDVREGAATTNLRMENSFVSEFVALFPNSTGYFTHYEDSYAPMTWHAKVGLRGRYILEMSIELQPSADRQHFPKSKAPRFSLLEITSAVKAPEGGYQVKYKGDSQIDFGPLQWRALVEKKGFLGALGVGEHPEPPIANFDSIWKDF